MCSPQEVCCFICYKTFDKDKTRSKKCSLCGDFKCPLCGGCMCNLTLGEQRVVLAMIKTYEKMLDTGYNFKQHEKIEKKVRKALQEKDSFKNKKK